MIITELRRTGTGTIDGSGVVFKFSGVQHSSAQGDLNLHLQAKTSRKVIPGSNSVVEQTLAVSWQPFDLVGEWDDKWGNIGTQRDGEFAFNTFQEFSKLVTRAPLVRLELDALSFVGIITDFKVRYVHAAKIGWAFTLSPHVNESVEALRIVKIETQSIPKWIQDLAGYNDIMEVHFDELQTEVPILQTPRVDEFTRVMLEINDAINRIQGIGADGFTNDTYRKLMLLATTFRRCRGAAYQATLALSRLTSSADLAFADILHSLRYAEWASSSLTTAWKMIGVATRAEIDTRRRANQRPKAIYYPKRGESLERISMRFYGTADNWRPIYDKNNLSSLVLDGTEELLIPERGQ